MALTESHACDLANLGTTIAPDFALAPTSVTGKTVRRDDFRGQKALLVMFICTHCPYVKHIEKGLAALGMDYDGEAGEHRRHQQQRRRQLSRRQPGRAEADKRRRIGFRSPILYDETQAVAHAYQGRMHAGFLPLRQRI